MELELGKGKPGPHPTSACTTPTREAKLSSSKAKASVFPTVISIPLIWQSSSASTEMSCVDEKERTAELPRCRMLVYMY